MKRRVLQHILFWLAYLAYKIYLNVSAFPKRAEPFSFVEIFTIVLQSQLTFLVVKIPLVYCLFSVVTKFNSKTWGAAKTFLASLLLLSGGAILFTILNDFYVVPYLYKTPGPAIAQIGLPSILYNAFVLVFVCGTALAIKLVRLNLQMRKKEEETVRKKLVAELQFLKSQINPHFLFNTLNNIYGLARKKDDNTAEVVMKLSKLLRFMLMKLPNNLSISLMN